MRIYLTPKVKVTTTKKIKRKLHHPVMMETDNKNDEDGSGEQSEDEEEDESTEMSAALKRRLKMVWYSS